jgi:hypothetical protein
MLNAPWANAINGTRNTFAKLEAWAAALPDQKEGFPSFYSNTGEEYAPEFFFGVISRDEPFDLEVAESVLCDQMQNAISTYLDSRKGTIYWRDPLEMDIWRDGIIVEHRADGPDMDHLTNRRCVKDKRFCVIKTYARLLKSDKAVLPNEELTARHRRYVEGAEVIPTIANIT